MGAPEELRVDSPPRISRAGFGAVLEDNHSPAALYAGECYDVLAGYGLDPAVALAFFQHESTYGTKGQATKTHNWGNLRSAPVDAAFADAVHGGWAWFTPRPDEPPGYEWVRSCRAWARLLAEVYVGEWNLTTVPAILRKYAPTQDGNAPAAYANAVAAQVHAWEQQYPVGFVSLEERVRQLEDQMLRHFPPPVVSELEAIAPAWGAPSASGPAETYTR